MLDRELLWSALDGLDRAAVPTRKGMRSGEHEDALSFVETNVEKSVALAEAFRRVLRNSKRRELRENESATSLRNLSLFIKK